MCKRKNKDALVLNEHLRAIETRWLKKEISLRELTYELIQYRNSVTFLHSKQEQLLMIKCLLLLDVNIEIRNERVSGIMLAFVPIMISYIAFFVSVYKLNNVSTQVWSLLVCTLTVGLFLVVFPVLKKHIGRYDKERAFYQIVLEIMDN